MLKVAAARSITNTITATIIIIITIMARSDLLRGNVRGIKLTSIRGKSGCNKRTFRFTKTTILVTCEKPT